MRTLRCGLLVISGYVSASMAQTPTGAVFGTAYDASGGIVSKCKISITDARTAASRSIISGPDGAFSAAALEPGEYQIRADAPGFKALIRPASVGAGMSTRADLHLEAGAPRETITVDGATPMINSATSEVNGTVTRYQIESLPLNGRNFLQLASLEPGVAVSPGYAGLFNRQFDVSVLGGNALHTMITVDGGSVWDPTTGGTGMNFSQEMVQEFQVSSANFDLSTGITAYGAINIVTRGGGNNFHGGGYFFYRDHHMAAYPGLTRSSLDPQPYFARRQPGFWVSGPLQRNRLFYFFNLEGNIQDSVYVVQPSSALLAGFGEVGSSPFRGKQLTARVDYRLNDRQSIMIRYSHDGNHTVAPPSTTVVSPSNWLENRNWSDQSMLSQTSVLSSTVVNDFRFSFWYWSNRNLAITRDQCTATCIGFGLPEIQVLGTNFVVGDTEHAPQGRYSRVWTYKDELTWKLNRHHVRFGGEFTHENVSGYWDLADPAVMTVYSPDLLSRLGLLSAYGLSGGLHTAADILKLPLYSFIVGVGDPTQPQPYGRAGARQNDRLHFYAQDTWRVRPDLTINYGLAWSFENNLLNYNLPKPHYLAPILGMGGLGPSEHNYRNFSPSLGVAWKLGRDGRTVVRAGAGIYYDTQLLWQRGEEPSYIGPFPNGHVVLDGGSIPNPVPGIPGAPIGEPIQFTTTPSGFTAGLLTQVLPGLRNALTQAFGVSGSNLALPTIDIAKSAAHLLPTHFPTSYSEHFSAGIQREMPAGIFVSGDFVFRQYMHVLFDDTNAPDYNHFYSARGPVIPLCSATQAANPAAQCSTGPITVWTPGGRGHFKGLLAKAGKRFGGRLQFTASYALASQAGFDASLGFADLNKWFANYGPVGPRHSLSLSGILNLPFKMQVSLISIMSSKLPAMPYIDQIDLSGSGTTYSALPGALFNCFNRGCGKSDLVRLTDQFNNTLAGKLTPGGQLIPRITLPASYSLGEGISSQDIRVARAFEYKERVNLRVFAEMFNVLNLSNRTAFNFNLNSPEFGQPTQRIGQSFGTGGPRALQLGARLTF